MGLVRMPYFVERARAAPTLLRSKFPFLARVRPTPYDREEVQKLITEAEKAYAVNSHRKVVECVDAGLRSLWSRPFREPRCQRDSDPDKQRLQSLIELLKLWDKAAAWLGVGETGELRSLHATRDLRRAHEAIGDTESANALYAGLAYCLLREGDFGGARDQLERGMPLAKQLDSHRYLIGAKASLAARTGFFSEAVGLYKQCCEIDEKSSAATPAFALATSSLGLAQARSSFGDEKREGRLRAFSGLDICIATGHVGFELQIRSGLTQYFLEVGDYDEAERVLTGSERLKRRHPDSFFNLKAELEMCQSLLLFLRQDINLEAKRQLTQEAITQLVQGYPWEAVSHIRDEILRSTLSSFLWALMRGDTFSAVSSLCVAAERVTLMLAEKHGLESGGSLDSLTRRNNALSGAGVYNWEIHRQFREIAMVRNSALHGIHNIRVRRLLPTVRALRTFTWLCDFIMKENLTQYQLSESPEVVNMRIFLGTSIQPENEILSAARVESQ